jgi:phosphomannomutase
VALIKSISGIRGTIGGKPGENLTPIDIVECTAAYGKFLLDSGVPARVVIGRDARISGEMVSSLVCHTLASMGFEILNLGLSTTPTVEMMVTEEQAGGGIIITASHNPKEWNALKFLNQKGEFISAADGETILKYIAEKSANFETVNKIGKIKHVEGAIQRHIDSIFQLPLVDVDAIKEKQFKIVVDCINSTGSISIVPMLEQLGCEVISLYDDLSGDFAHNPEPLPAHLSALSREVQDKNANLGVSVDPDVDRLAMVCEDGEMFGEEYSLVAIADYVLKHNPGNTVSNLSSTRALNDVTVRYGGKYHAAAVGEVNVVVKMKEENAVIGGEGNGGIIYPELHYGRDAMVGLALFLSHLAHFGRSVSYLRSLYPNYWMSKNKINLTPEIDIDSLLTKMEEKYKRERINKIDGLKIDFEDSWIHLRKSNTEPIIRIYAEASSQLAADNLSEKIKSDIGEILRGRS